MSADLLFSSKPPSDHLPWFLKRHSTSPDKMTNNIKTMLTSTHEQQQQQETLTPRSKQQQQQHSPRRIFCYCCLYRINPLTC
jgi:hypothetical protein